MMEEVIVLVSICDILMFFQKDNGLKKLRYRQENVCHVII